MEIEKSGNVQIVQLREASELLWNGRRLEENWEIGRTAGNNGNVRPISITPSDIVVVENIHREELHGENLQVVDYRSIVSFHPPSIDDAAHSALPLATLELDFQCEILRMERIRDDHVVLMCRSHGHRSTFDGETENTNAENDTNEQVHAIIIHVPTRKIIDRVCLLEDVSMFDPVLNSEIPIFFAASGKTVGVGVWWKGIILSGRDVRSVGNDAKRSNNEDPSQIGKKKKSRQKSTKQEKGGCKKVRQKGGSKSSR
jgi:hypothetical protein